MQLKRINDTNEKCEDLTTNWRVHNAAVSQFGERVKINASRFVAPITFGAECRLPVPLIFWPKLRTLVICYCNFVTCNSLLPNTVGAGNGRERQEGKGVKEVLLCLASLWQNPGSATAVHKRTSEKQY